MKKIILICCVFCLFSCQEKQIETKKPVVVEQKQELDELNMSNPALFAGTDFVSFFQTCYKLGYFETMLKYTSKEDLDAFGDMDIKEIYKKSDFSYPLKLISVEKIDDKNFLLSYKTVIFATEKIKRFKVIVENDTCRISLNKDLKTIEQ